MARVEALAGPQGTLYGASSMAGTIKLVTNKPDTRGFYGELSTELNSVSHGDIGGTVEGFINAPISENIAVRAVGWYRRDGGYIDNVRGTRTYPTSGVVADNAALVEKTITTPRHMAAVSRSALIWTTTGRSRRRSWVRSRRRMAAIRRNAA